MRRTTARQGRCLWVLLAVLFFPATGAGAGHHAMAVLTPDSPAAISTVAAVGVEPPGKGGRPDARPLVRPLSASPLVGMWDGLEPSRHDPIGPLGARIAFVNPPRAATSAPATSPHRERAPPPHAV